MTAAKPATVGGGPKAREDAANRAPVARRAVVVSPLLPFPIDTGKKMVLAGILRFLVEEYGAANVTWVCVGAADTTATAAEVPGLRIVVLGGIGRLRQVMNVLWHVLLRRRMALQEAALWSPRLFAALARECADYAPDLIVYDTVRMARYRGAAEGRDARHVLHMEDLFSIRYRRMLNASARLPGVRLDPLGNFGAHLPKIAAAVVRWEPLQRSLLEFESEIISRREREVTRQFDACLLLNDAEARELAASAHTSNVFSLPPATGIEIVQRQRSPSGTPTFVFLGSLGFPANYVSISHFLDKQMHRVLALMPDARVIIAGRGADAALERRVARFDGAVVLQGYVPDLDDVLRSATAMIVPLLFGSGIKLKTLEALARGVPVLATDYGLDGIPAVPGMNCLLENDLARFPEHMLELCDPATNSRIGAAGRELFRATYSAVVVRETYRRHFGRAAVAATTGDG